MNLDEASDQLYSSSLDDFVSERTRLAKELRTAGKPEDAGTLSESRKPTVGAWVLNQLARRNRRDVDLLLDAGHRLREGQAGALGGHDREAFVRAQKTQSDLLRRLRGEAERLLREERGVAAATVLNQVEEALRATAVSETGREALARGGFVEPPQAEGFDVVSELAGMAPNEPARRKDRAQNERRDATARLKVGRAKLRDAERTAVEAERGAERASREAQRVRGEADTARAQVDAAAREVDDAERKLRERSARSRHRTCAEPLRLALCLGTLSM
jgi:hypothetical protein